MGAGCSLAPCCSGWGSTYTEHHQIRGSRAHPMMVTEAPDIKPSDTWLIMLSVQEMSHTIQAKVKG